MATNPEIQKILAEQEERKVRWKSLLRTDPRRTVRVLTAAGWASETIDGDTPWDVPCILACLQDPSKTPQSVTWKRLVNAGLFTALCKCSTKMHIGALVPADAPAFTEEEKRARIKEWASPWYDPLAIICTAAVGCAIPPTATEKRMVEEVTLNWTSVVKRIWAEPTNSLDPDADRVLERAIVAQIVLRMGSLDPRFFNVVFSSADMTLAVCFRNWVHATAREDVILNNSLILSLLNPTVTSPWREYFAAHAPPPASQLMRRFVQGASLGTGGFKKRTPQEAARAVASAFATHFSIPGMAFSDVLQEVGLLTTLWTAAAVTDEFAAFAPAVCSSEELWAALPHVVRRAANEQGGAGKRVIEDILTFYGKMLRPVVSDGPQAHADALVHGWVAGGLFDMLEDNLELMMSASDGMMSLTFITTAIDACTPHLSTETRAELHAQLPRTGMVWKMLKASLASGENADVQTYRRNISGFFMSGRGIPDPRNPLWRQGAWEMLALLGHKVRPPDDCARRGCEKPAGGLWCAVGSCMGTRYCSRTCMKADVEHREMCSKGWFAISEKSCRSLIAAESVDGKRPSEILDMAALQVEDFD